MVVAIGTITKALYQFLKFMTAFRLGFTALEVHHNNFVVYHCAIAPFLRQVGSYSSPPKTAAFVAARLLSGH